MVKYLVQDIETVPENELLGMWFEEKQKRAALGKPHDFPDIWAHKVICIGLLALDEDLKPVHGGCAAGGCVGGKSEREMIVRWSDAASGKSFKLEESLRLVDWNGARFDVPVLQTRAFRYGIQLPWLFGLQPDNRGGISQWSKEYRDKYAGKHDDVSELWTNRGLFPKPHLANLAKLMGLPGKVGIDGSKIQEVWEGRAINADAVLDIDRYCMEDVIQTAFVFQRFRYLSGRFTLEQYRSAAEALITWVGAQPHHKAFAEMIDRKALLLEDDVVPSA